MRTRVIALLAAIPSSGGALKPRGYFFGRGSGRDHFILPSWGAGRDRWVRQRTIYRVKVPQGAPDSSDSLMEPEAAQISKKGRAGGLLSRVRTSVSLRILLWPNSKDCTRETSQDSACAHRNIGDGMKQWEHTEADGTGKLRHRYLSSHVADASAGHHATRRLYGRGKRHKRHWRDPGGRERWPRVLVRPLFR